ncbi:MAG TPA: response regulator [Candidatus Acidoferrales bacterium]|nr:response regulator [Candidatus Acidoferrales bacterium]
MGELTVDTIATLEKPMAEATETNEAAAAADRSPERRRRLRTKLSAPVRVRANAGVSQKAEVCTTVDASRDGLLFTTQSLEYRRGMDLAVTFPYSGAAGGVQHERTAVVARVFEMPEGRYGVGIRFYEGKRPNFTAEAAEDAKTSSSGQKAGAVALDLEKPKPLVLVVEEDRRAREAMTLVLNNEGYAVETVETGAEAVEILRQRTPNLLITEIEITDMSGYDLCLIVKSNERLQRVPVVMTTRAGQPNDYSTAHALGAIVCMSKPYKQERLLHVVRMLAPTATAQEMPALPSMGRQGRVNGRGHAHQANGHAHNKHRARR